MQCGWIQEPSATDRKINNFGKGGVDKQRLVESDWKNQESAHPAPPHSYSSQKASPPSEHHCSLCSIFHWKGISGRLCFGWKSQLTLNTCSFQGQRGFLRICPALCSMSPLKPDSSLCYSWFFAPASWSSQMKMLPSLSSKQRVTGSLERIIQSCGPRQCPKRLECRPSLASPNCSTEHTSRKWFPLISAALTCHWPSCRPELEHREDLRNELCAGCWITMDSPRWSQCSSSADPI